MNVLKYNFDDLYKASSGYKTRQQGVVMLFYHLHKHDWVKFFKTGRNKILDTTRWCHYMVNVEEFYSSDISLMDRAIIIKLASLRDYADFNVYGNNTIKIERIKDIPIERIEEISLIKIENNKIKLRFED